MPTGGTGTGGATYPDVSLNHSRALACLEIAGYASGGSRPEVLMRAGLAWDASVRSYNATLWQFNRMIDDIEFTVNTAEFQLTSNFRAPQRCELLDAVGGKAVRSVEWLEYPEFLLLEPLRTTGTSSPRNYSIRNINETGMVTFHPPLGDTIQYPVARIHYLRRIELAVEQQDKLQVPMEVDQAILDEAVGRFLAMEKGHDAALTAMRFAAGQRSRAEALWMDWPDLNAAG